MKKRLKQFLQRRILRAAPLQYRLTSGVKVEVSDRMDWIIYNDLFVEGDYDIAIRDVLEGNSKVTRILDLGANKGFFILRTIDLLKSSANATTLEVKAVEADMSLCKTLENNLVPDEIGAKVQLEIVHGLAGSRGGETQFYTSADHGLNSLFRKTGNPEAVSFLELDKFTETWEKIDLVKCDIEGAELLLIENYPQLLSKTSRLVIEFHPEFCDLQKALKLLDEYGFANKRLIKDYGRCLVFFFSR